MYINQKKEEEALSHWWTYESGYDQGYRMGRACQADRNYFPRFTSAWYGHKAGYQDGKNAWKRGY
ncbi:MAG: hypothetical protein KC449_05170 [Anaerolineales bacterium]|nr:hypothetical protein [Anaerolineales bacterium]